jgi:Tol biopolymer transport system component
MIGKTISHYEITAKLGEGGMGEVYRANDIRLNRDVAIKLLPESFVQDVQRMGRFQREAQVLASLNHPNIAAIYGVEEENGQKALVMELAEGEDLSTRIARGPIPLEEALPIALQIAEALENAHKHGIIHRDLKPANIRISAEGRVKILDFGLAKALEEDRSPEDIANSPTLTMAATQAGIILGTAAYMSPEQARGRPVDRRTDIWAFGAVLFEMITGNQAFIGSDISEIMANVITREPPWDELPGDLPGAIQLLLERCLRKKLEMRLPDAGMARITIQEHLDSANEETSEGAGAASPSVSSPLGMALMAVGGVIIGLVVALLWMGGSGVKPGEVMELDLVLEPPAEVRSTPAISPNGKDLVYASYTSGRAMLYHRRLSERASRLIAGTEAADLPFFSPDGQWIGFFAGGRLKKVFLRGGQPESLCAYAGGASGGVWTSDGEIVFTTIGARLPHRVSSNGGTAVPVEVQSEDDIIISGIPRLLPTPGDVLFTVMKISGTGDSQVAILSLDTGRLKLLTAGSDPRFVEPNILVYLRASRLVLNRIDLDEQSLVGPSRVLQDAPEIVDSPRGFYVRAEVSASGTAILERTAPDLQAEIVQTNWKGDTVSEIELEKFDIRGSPAASIRLSPDGNKLAVTARAVSVVNLQDGNTIDLVRHQGFGSSAYGHWSPDGKTIAFIDNRSGKFMTYGITADGKGTLHLLTDTELPSIGVSFSPEGNQLLGYLISPESSRDLWVFPLGSGSPAEVLKTPANERAPVFSPDGELIAFVSDEEGRDQVYVREFPEGGRNWKVSTEGGVSPQWGRDGQNLFYRTNTDMMRVTVQSSPTLQFGRPEHLFDASQYATEPFGVASYDLSLDNQHFLFVRVKRNDIDHWAVVLNWNKALEELLQN